MNHIYRIVWRAALGTWVAVAETARGQGKTAKAASAEPAATPQPRRRAPRVLPLLGLLAAAGAFAQTAVVAPGGQTNVYVSPNGVTVVNIAGANAAGLSHNRYQQFNVDARGLVLNNTSTAQIQYQSQLAGQVMANYNTNTPARVILNEVVANNRSQLAGYTEVLGGRADVVIANPYGITCGGCGFINTDRVTLTTGLPTIRPDGSLGGFAVNQGDILIQGSGLNGTAQQILDLVTRSVKIDGQLNAQDLGITTGANNWDYASRSVTGPATPSGATPAYAIDSSALGGMYANRIRLVATDAGVGVRMLGNAAASASDFTLSAAGRIELVNNKISAQRDVLVASNSNDAAAMALTGASVSAARNASLQAQQGGAAIDSGTLAGASVRVSAGTLATGAGTKLQATQDLELEATSGDMRLGGAAVQSAGALRLTATGTVQTSAATGQGVQSLGGDVAIAAASLVNEGTITADSGSLQLDLGATLSNSGTLHAAAGLGVAAADAVNTGQLLSGADASLNVGSLDNRGALAASGALAIDAGGAVANALQGTLKGASLNVAASGLTNAGLISADGGNAVLRVDGALDNAGRLQAAGDLDIGGRSGATALALHNRSELLAQGAMRIDAGSVANDSTGWIQATRGSTVHTGALDNQGTWLSSTEAAGTQDSIVASGALTNSGKLVGANDLALAAAGLRNSGAMASQGNLSAASSADLENTADAIVQAGGALSLDAAGALANAGTLKGADVALAAGNGLDNSGVMSAASGAMTVRANGAIDNSGAIGAAGRLDVADRSGGASEDLRNSGQIFAGDTLALAANAVTNTPAPGITDSGWIQAGNASNISAASLSNAGTWLLSQQTGAVPASSVQVTGTLTNSGLLETSQDAAIAAARFDNQASGVLRAGRDLQATINGSGRFDNSGWVQANGVLDVTGAAGSLNNAGGATLLGSRLAVDVATLDNAGTVQGGSSGASSIKADALTNRATGTLTAATGGGSGSVTARTLVNDGTLQADGALAVKLGSATQNGSLSGSGKLLASGDLHLASAEGRSYSANVGGALQAGGLLDVQGDDASSLSIAAGTSASGGSVNVATGSVAVAAGGALSAGGSLALDALTLTLADGGTSTGRVLAGTDATLNVRSDFSNGGLLFSAGNLSLTAPSITNGSNAAISALETLNVRANAGALDLGADAPPAGSGGLTNNGLIYAGVLADIGANGELRNNQYIQSDGSISLLANKVVNKKEITAAQDLRVVANTIENNQEDTRIWNTDEASAENAATAVRDGGQWDDGGDGGNLNEFRNWKKEWTRYQTYDPSRPLGAAPQMTAGGTVQLVFHTGSNVAGLIYGGTSVDMVGFSVGGTDKEAQAAIGLRDGKNAFVLSGATFLNDSLPLETRSYLKYWTEVREEAGPAGGIENFDWGVCGQGEHTDDGCSEGAGHGNGIKGGYVNSSYANGLTAGIYTATLTGSGFALTNNSGTSTNLQDNRRSGTPDHGTIDNDVDGTAPDAVGGSAAATGKAAGLGRSPGLVADAPAVTAISFLAENTANGVKGTSFGGIDLKLPTSINGYFVQSTDSNARYLVETNPLYLSGAGGMGSNYLAQLLGYNPDTIGLRLGDASYEAYLVKQQLVAQTGNVVLAGYQNADAQMKGLMESAANQSQALGLQYGKALTPEQQAALKTDMVWMVQTEINGKTVLAPVVYLAQSTRLAVAGGAVISAQDANLNLTALTNIGGTISGANSLVIASAGDITNLSGLIKGGDVSLTSTGGSIVNKTYSQGGGDDTFYSTTIGKTAGIESTRTLTLDAAKDISNIGATMNAGTDASLKAGNNITFDTIENKTTNTTGGGYSAGGGSGYTTTTTSTVEQVKSGLTVGGNLEARAGNDITLAGTDAKIGGNASLDAGNDLNIVARENSTTTKTESKTSGFGMNNSLYGSTTTNSDSLSVRNVGSSLQVGGDAALKAGNDITIQGSTVDVKGSGDLQAGNNINVLAGRNYDESNTTTKSTGVMQVSSGSGKSKEGSASAEASSGRGLASASAGASGSAGGTGSAGLAFSSTTTTTTNSTDLEHVGSTLNFGKDLNVQAGQDVNLQGSTINAGGNAAVSATNVNLLAAEDKHTTSTTSTTTRVGLMASTDNKVQGQAGASASAQGGKGTPGASAQASAGATATSENKVDLFQREETSSSTLDTRNQGSAINAGGNLSVTAKDTLTLQGSAMSSGGDMDLKATDMKFLAAEDKHETTSSSNVTTAGLYADAKAQGSAQASGDVGLGAQAGASAGGSAGIEVGLYGSNTTSHSTEGSTTAVTSSLKSGGDINRTATNNITDVGTQIEGAGNLNQSAQTIDSIAARNTTYSSSDSTTHTAKVGAYAQAGAEFSAQGQVGPNASKPKKEGGAGAGIRASYEYDNSNAASSSSEAVTSSIRMGGNVTSTSTGKTTMEGTQIAAGGDVTLGASSLDYQAAKNTSSSSSSDKSASASVNVDILKKEVGAEVGYEGNKSNESSSTAVVGGISAGGNLNVKTTGDARFEGTQLAAGGAASVDAGGNVSFDAAKNTATSHSEGQSVDVSASGGKSGGAAAAAVGVNQANYSLDQDVAGSISSGSGPLTIKSGGDASFTGTQIASTSGDVTVAAGGNIDMKAARTVEHSDSLGVDVSASGSGGKDTKGGTKNATTGKKSGGTAVDQRAGAASFGVATSKSDSNTASVGSISSGAGSITLSSGGNTKLEGTQVAAATGIGVATGGTFEMKDAVSTRSSSTVGVSASASGSSQTPRTKAAPQTTGTGTSGTPSGTPTAPTPAPKPSTTTTGGGASKPPAAPPPLTPTTQQTLTQAGQGAGSAGSGGTQGAAGTQTAALTQKGGSGSASVYVDNQSSTSSQATTLNGGSGAVVVQQGVKPGTGAPAAVSASVPLVANAPKGSKPVATLSDGKPLPAWLKFDPATGKLQGTPPPDFKGEVKVQVKVPQADGSTRAVPVVFGAK